MEHDAARPAVVEHHEWTIEAKLRRSWSAAATNAAFTSGGTQTLTTSVLETVKYLLLCVKR